ncbi:hypothetical protein Prum_103410 [Phytohabitans rumicis]|uniref:Uncharacterized protein n=1 Tax=Phytohabitans rumicis TaxID=1076125 RepID=A0A6V8LPX2_9ACTN|nr:hypothetical protein Prum_103410 [Phytohabitans rumicis]
MGSASSGSPPGRHPAGVEVMSVEQLRSRIGRSHQDRPLRPTFHHLLTLVRGTLWHTVDFTGYALVPGMWLWVRPGQVQQWGDLHEVDGTLILFESDFLDRATAAGAHLNDAHAPVVYEPDDADHQRLTSAAEHLSHAFAGPASSRSTCGRPCYGTCWPYSCSAFRT